jgi:uncharacterized protein DUF6665
VADGPNLLAGLEEELRSERAYALGRAGKKVEAALAELTAGGADEDELVFAAATAVWHYVIGREAMGLYDHREALEIYGVPARVMAKVGVVKRS